MTACYASITSLRISHIGHLSFGGPMTGRAVHVLVHTQPAADDTRRGRVPYPAQPLGYELARLSDARCLGTLLSPAGTTINIGAGTGYLIFTGRHHPCRLDLRLCKTYAHQPPTIRALNLLPTLEPTVTERMSAFLELPCSRRCSEYTPSPVYGRRTDSRVATTAE